QRIMHQVFKALADPTRRRVLQLLKERPLTAGEIASHVAIAKPTLSAHLAILREAGLVGPEKDRKTLNYWPNASVLEEAVLAFADTVGLGLERESLRVGATRKGAAS